MKIMYSRHLWRLALCLVILVAGLPKLSEAQESIRAESRDIPTAIGMRSLPGTTFIHRAVAGNIVSNWTYIDHPSINSNPNAIVFVTPNWNPGGVGGVYNNHPIGVWYNTETNKWAIFNQDLADMPINAAFNVLIINAPNDANTLALVHIAFPSTISGNWTFLNELGRFNSTSKAILFVTPNWNPSGSSGIYNNHPIGVMYTDNNIWVIFNQDLADIPANAAFNVLATDQSSTGHSSTLSNTVSNSTYIDHPLTNNNPNAIIFVTPISIFANGGEVYNDHPIGVWYNKEVQKWAIFNQDLASIPLNDAFNLLIEGSKVFLPLVKR